MVRARRRKLRRLRITIDDLDVGQILALQYGVSDAEVVYYFGSAEEMRKLWAAVRDDFMPNENAPPDDEICPAPGTRPWAWWMLERELPMPDTPAEQYARLQALRELRPWERS